MARTNFDKPTGYSRSHVDVSCAVCDGETAAELFEEHGDCELVPAECAECGAALDVDCATEPGGHGAD